MQHKLRQKAPCLEPFLRNAEDEVIRFEAAVVSFLIEISHKKTTHFAQKPVAFLHAEEVVIRFEPIQVESRQNKTRIRICIQNAAGSVKEFRPVINTRDCIVFGEIAVLAERGIFAALNGGFETKRQNRRVERHGDVIEHAVVKVLELFCVIVRIGKDQHRNIP
ncbi:hypothetical protein SDC9_93477 [bioreactor metagenome]|uniref:Uncharacterized protein n=1 Tax=bioreactor metagenome TaxID=1076179 RepID=A0A645A3E0_9ZZZZ